MRNKRPDRKDRNAKRKKEIQNTKTCRMRMQDKNIKYVECSKNRNAGKNKIKKLQKEMQKKE